MGQKLDLLSWSQCRRWAIAVVSFILTNVDIRALPLFSIFLMSYCMHPCYGQYLIIIISHLLEWLRHITSINGCTWNGDDVWIIAALCLMQIVATFVLARNTSCTLDHGSVSEKIEIHCNSGIKILYIISVGSMQIMHICNKYLSEPSREYPNEDCSESDSS